MCVLSAAVHATRQGPQPLVRVAIEQIPGCSSECLAKLNYVSQERNDGNNCENNGTGLSPLYLCVLPRESVLCQGCIERHFSSLNQHKHTRSLVSQDVFPKWPEEQHISPQKQRNTARFTTFGFLRFSLPNLAHLRAEAGEEKDFCIVIIYKIPPLLPTPKMPSVFHSLRLQKGKVGNEFELLPKFS